MLPLHVLASISAAGKIISQFKWPSKPMEKQQVVPLPSNNSSRSRRWSHVPMKESRVPSIYRMYLYTTGENGIV